MRYPPAPSVPSDDATKCCTRHCFFVPGTFFCGCCYFVLPDTVDILASLCSKILTQGGGAGGRGSRCCIDGLLVLFFFVLAFFSLACSTTGVSDRKFHAPSVRPVRLTVLSGFGFVARWVRAFRAGLSVAVSVRFIFFFAFFYRLLSVL